MPKLVGLCGRAGSGKSVAAEALEEIGFTRLRFSTPLKEMLRAFFRVCGLSEIEIERRIEGDLKETPDVLLCGKTPRYAMQTLGLEWGRKLIDAEIWSKAWEAAADAELTAGRSIVAEDVRFATEADAIYSRGGTVVKLKRREGESVDQAAHPSERFDGVFPDILIENTGTIEELKGAIIYAFRDPNDDEVAA